MAIINYASKEVQFKIVLHGPPFAGKSTMLHFLHDAVEAAARTELRSLTTGADRTLHFGFHLPESAVMEGFKTTFELWTVPGEPKLNAARQLVLRDADGVALVADSCWERVAPDYDSLCNLDTILRRQNHTLDDLPAILLLNKRDAADAANADYLQFVLNRRRHPAPVFETVATRGSGVFEAFSELTAAVAEKFRRSDASRPPGALLGIEPG